MQPSSARRFTVLDRPQDDPAGRITTLVHGFFAKRSIDRPVGSNDDLSASGLSSLDMVNLMLAVEAEFDLKIPDREMTPSNFRSIAHITKLVRDLS
jgi:acyl carrier protein